MWLASFERDKHKVPPLCLWDATQVDMCNIKDLSRYVTSG